MESEFFATILSELENGESLLHEELIQGGSSREKIREKNFKLLSLLIEHPEYSPREYEERIEEYPFVLNELRGNKLNVPNYRKRLAEIMKSVGNETVNLLMERASDPLSSYNSVAKIILSKFFDERKIEGKAFLISLMYFSNWQSKENEKINKIREYIELIARKGSYKLCREVSRRIISHIGVKYGFEKKKSRTELMESNLEDLEKTQDIDDLRMTLLYVQKDLKDLKKDIESEIETKSNDFLIRFFSSLNSANNSYLLDTVETIIAELKDERISIDYGLEYYKKTLEIITKIFSNLLKLNNVVPIENVGDIIEIMPHQLSSYDVENYLPNNYRSINDKKLVVEIKTPGWKINNFIISKPKIIIK